MIELTLAVVFLLVQYTVVGKSVQVRMQFILYHPLPANFKCHLGTSVGDPSTE